MNIPSNKITDVIRYFRQEMQGIYDDGELESIIAYCFEEFAKIKRSELNIRKTETISESVLLKFNFAIKDLKKHKPIQYVLGTADFLGMKFKVNKDVLIPRPETEELVDLIIREAKADKSKEQPLQIIDIGTGSGCIAIALKKNIPHAQVTAMDISLKALAVAKQNAVVNNTEINFVNDNILKLKKKYAASSANYIVSNPPYVCNSEKAEMHKNVLKHEPHLALFVDDTDPLLFYRVIADFAVQHLTKGGKLFFELNQALGEETKALLAQKGFKNISLIKDINNKTRILRCEI